jgi:ligand-binding sensor domain-containing protein/signal transduction histidine kinase
VHKQLADSITLRWFVRALLFALPAFCPAALPPLTPTRAGVEIVDGSPIRFHRLSTADGLSQTRVSHIVQDDRGFMWFGTQYGLNRFDGYRFKVFVHDPAKSESLSGVYISALFKDHNGTLWVGCDPYLDRFNPVTETFTHYTLDADDRDRSPITLSSINEDTDGMLWLSTSKGLYRLDPANGRIARYRHAANDPASLGSNEVKTTGQDRSGQFWVGNSVGLDLFNRQTGKVTRHVPVPDSGSGFFFHEDRQGVFWVVSGPDGRLGVFDRSTNAIVPYLFQHGENSSGNPETVFAMLEDATGTMWFGTSLNGLLRLDREHNRALRYRNNPSDPDSLAGDRITALFQDAEGNLWTGLHQAGPNYFSTRPSLFQALANKDGNHMTGLVGTVFEDSRGVIWLATPGKLDLIDQRTKQTARFKATDGVDVLSVIEPKPKMFWIATGGKGLIQYNQKTGSLTTYRSKPSDLNSLTCDLIERLLISRDGSLWAATWDGLGHFDARTQRFRSYRPEAARRGLTFHAIAEDPKGILWLGSNQGLHRFDPASGEFTLYNNSPRDLRSLSDNRVNSVHIDRSGVIWAGTQNGLDSFDPSTKLFTNYYQRDGLAGNVVSCILQDDRGVLWMSTNNGVSSFAPRERRFSNYGIADGLPGTDLTGWGACSSSASGKMFFGGYSGAVAVHPDQAFTGSYVPQVFLTNFRLFGTDMSLGAGSPLKQSIVSTTSIALSHWQNFFALEFSALSYFSPLTNRYRYMLEGLDPHWIEVGADRRLANYTSVPPGFYTFRVQGATSRGQWSQPGVVLVIHVLAPWWKTVWFQALTLMLAMVGLGGILAMRTRAITRRIEERFSERHAERLRIARELHDTLIQGFQGLIVKVQAVTNTIPPELPARSLLNQSLNRADQMIVEGRDRVRDLRSSESSGDSIVVAIRHMVTGLQKECPADLKFKITGEPYPLRFDVHDDMLAVCKEILSNSVQHADAKSIACDLRFSKREIRFLCRDDGKGIPADILRSGARAGHWGLLGIRERAKRMGGKLNMESTKSAGTMVEIRVPARSVGRWDRTL